LLGLRVIGDNSAVVEGIYHFSFFSALFFVAVSAACGGANGEGNLGASPPNPYWRNLSRAKERENLVGGL